VRNPEPGAIWRGEQSVNNFSSRMILAGPLVPGCLDARHWTEERKSWVSGTPLMSSRRVRHAS
jgi:hypothetical protein